MLAMRRFQAFGVLLLAAALLASCGGADEPVSSSSSNGLPPPQTAVTNLSLLEPPGGKLRNNPAAAADLPLNATVLMDWAESVYSDLFAGAQTNQVFAPYIYRYYPATGNYLGVDGDKVYVLGPATGGVLSYVGRIGNFRCRIYPESCAAAPTLTLQFGVDNRIPVTAGAPTVTVPVSVFGAASSTPLQLELQGAPNFASVDGMQIVVNAVATPPIARKYEFTAVVRDSSSDEIVARVSGGIDVSVVGQAGQTREFVNGQTVPFSEFGLSVLAGTSTFGSGRATVTVESVKQANGTDAIQITTSEPQVGDLVIAPIDSSSPSGTPGRRASAGSKIFAERQLGSRECVAEDEELESALSNGRCARVWTHKTRSVLCKGDIDTRGSIATTLLRSGFQTGLTVARLVLDPTASSLNAIRLPSSTCEGGTVTSIVSLQTWSQLYRPDVAITSDKVQPVLLINGYSVDVGLGGGKSTWANTADLLGRSIADDGTKIVVWEFRWRTNTTFQQAAVDLTEAIERVYAESGNRKVALVAHSFGGLLARTALQRPASYAQRDLKNVSEVGRLDDKVKSLVTIGTPHSGIASEAATFYERKFPIGSDNVGNNFCGQISCYQAGEQGRNKAPGEPMPGYIVAELSNFVQNPMPTGVERIYSLIGLKLGRPDLNPLNGTTYTQLEGDGLISYRGQRFYLADGAAEVHPALKLGVLAFVRPRPQRQLEEKVLGVIGQPAFGVRSPTSLGLGDVQHSKSFATGTPFLLGLAEHAEPYIECPYAWSCSHPTWVELQKIFLKDLNALAGPPGAFNVTSVNPACSRSERKGPGIRLSWNTATAADKYVVYRDGTEAGSVASTARQYLSNEGVRAGQTYTYVVAAVNSLGTTTASAALVAVPLNICGELPAVPSTLSAVISGVSPQSLVANGVSQAISVLGSNFIAGNAVQVKYSGSGGWRNTNSPPTVLSSSSILLLVNPGLTADTLQLRVCKTASSPTSESNSECSTPVSLSVVVPYALRGVITDAGGLPVSGYYVYGCSSRNGIGGLCEGSVQSVTAADGSFSLSVQENVAYYLSINNRIPGSSGFLGYYSSPVNGISSSASAVTTLTVSGRDISGIRIQVPGTGSGGAATVAPTVILPSSNATGQSLTPVLQWNGGAATYWQVNIRNLSTNVIVHTSAALAAAQTSYTVPSGALQAATQYRWDVTACPDTSCSNPATYKTSANAFFTTAGAATPSPVVATVSSVAPLSMNANGSDQSLTVFGSGFSAGNTVQFLWGAGAGAGVWTNARAGASVISSGQINVVINPGTVSDTIYVRVCNTSFQCSGGSTSIQVTAATVTPPSVPSVSGVSPSSMTANASDQSLTIFGSGFATGNTVQFLWGSGSGAGVWTNARSGASVNSSGQISVAVNPGSVNDTIYVRVCNASFQCSAGSSFVRVTAPTPAPAVPGSFSLSNSAPYCDTNAPAGPAVAFSWSGSANATSYQLIRNSQTVGGATSGTSFVNNVGLVAGGNYSYFVRASNANGTRDSNSVSVSIPANVCTPNASGLSPNSVNRNSGTQSLTIFGSNYYSGNWIAFRWLAGGGGSSSRAPTSVSGSQLQTTFNPGSVVDTIYVRVCESSSLARCSSEFPISVR